MADTLYNLSATAAAYAQKFPAKVITQVNRAAVLLAILSVQPGIGKNVSWDVEGDDGQLAENFAEGADAANFGSDTPVPATLSTWGHYRANFHISDTAEAVGQVTNMPSDLRSPWQRNWMNSIRKLASKINGAFYTDDGTGTKVHGLVQVALRDDNTYATIDRTAGGGVTNAFWKAKVFDPGVATVLTRDQIGKDTSDIKVASNERPDIALCHPDVFQKVRALFEPGRRWNKEIYTARGKTILDNSADVIIIDNCQFIEDKDCPNNDIVYLNSNYVHIETLPRPNGTGWAPLPGDALSEAVQAYLTDDHRALLSSFYTKELATLGDSRRATTVSKLHLVVTKPNACGIRKNVSTT